MMPEYIISSIKTGKRFEKVCSIANSHILLDKSQLFHVLLCHLNTPTLKILFQSFWACCLWNHPYVSEQVKF